LISVFLLDVYIYLSLCSLLFEFVLSCWFLQYIFSICFVEWGPVIYGCQVSVTCVYFIRLHFSWLPSLYFLYGPLTPSGTLCRLPVGWVGPLIFSYSQHLSSGLTGFFIPQCLKIGELLCFLRLSSLFFFFSLFDWLLGACCLFNVKLSRNHHPMFCPLSGPHA
jgi:hypothetical protein